MYVQDNLMQTTTKVADLIPENRFSLMFSTVVVGPLVAFALAGRDPNMLSQPSLLWSLLAIPVLLLISVGGGLLRFKNAFHAAAGLSIAVGKLS